MNQQKSEEPSAEDCSSSTSVAADDSTQQLTPLGTTESEPDDLTKGGDQSKTRRDGRAYVPKNSLTEEALLADRERARAILKRKKKSEITPEDIAEERKTSNRLSEFQSRQRRKKIVDDLKKTAEEQSQHSAFQSRQITELQAELQAVRQENLSLRQQLEARNQAQMLPSNTGNNLHQGSAGLLQLLRNNISNLSSQSTHRVPQHDQTLVLTTLLQQISSLPADELDNITRLLQELVAINQQQTMNDNNFSSPTYPPSNT